MARKPPKGKSLAEVNAELAKHWHPNRNGDLGPKDVFAVSGIKVWWKCDKYDDHEWESNISVQVKRDSCPVCKTLAVRFPDIAKEWHPNKNGDLTPYDVTDGSGKVVWWKCNKSDDHEWEARIASRTKQGSTCSICRGKKIIKSNSLQAFFPEISKQWHPTKNGDLKPYQISPFNPKKVWWKCDKADDHEWEAAVGSRTKEGATCPICCGRKFAPSNSLAAKYPALAKEWHPTKNGKLTPENTIAGGHDKIWWKCDKGEDHEWQTSIIRRKQGRGCHVCENKKIVLSNCLATTHPKIAKEWHPTKNKKLTAYDVTIGSHNEVWWKCDKGDDHEWYSSVHARSGVKCPICSNRRVVLSNCLAVEDPELAKQWHPTRNGDLTAYDIVLKSGRKVWWKCDKADDHEWVTDPNHRSQGRNCPFCTLTPQSRQELTITFELIQFFKDINPKGFKTRVKGKLWSIDIYIPQLKLGIEFDGSYWHKDKSALDKLKTEKLEEEGFEIFRVREEPLKKIFDDDIMSKQPFNAKQVVNDILTQIMSRYTIDAKKIAKIESYIAKKKLQNEKGLDKYIDMILKEKAEKNVTK